MGGILNLRKLGILQRTELNEEFHVQFCESLWGKFPGATQPWL